MELLEKVTNPLAVIAAAATDSRVRTRVLVDLEGLVHLKHHLAKVTEFASSAHFNIRCTSY